MMMFYAGIDSAAEAAKEKARRGRNSRRAFDKELDTPAEEAMPAP